MTDRNKLICIMSKIVPLPFHQLARIADHLTDHGVTVQKWIPVTERLPELECHIYSVDVMFYHTDNDIRIGYLNFETGNWKDRESRVIFAKNDVTHWMPLPETPKEV